MNSIHLIFQFIISGSIVVCATLISKNFDSKWSGLLVALPIMTILGYIFISLNTDNTDKIIAQRYLISALIFMIPAAIYILSLYLLNDKLPLYANLFLSIIPLGISVILLQRLI